MLYVAMIAIAFWISDYMGKLIIKNEYSEFLALSEYEIGEQIPSDELLQYENAEAIYESVMLGNTNRNLLANGKYCDKGSYKAESTKNGLVLTTDGKPKTIHAELASYLNIINETLYFRDDKDFCLWMYDFSDQSAKSIVGERVGQITATADAIYYIDITENNSLKVLREGKITVNLFKDVDSFAILGSSIYYLSKDHALRKYSLIDKTTSIIQWNVNKFIIANGIIIENNGSLIEFSLSGKKARMLYSGSADLINADEKRVLYSEYSRIYMLDRKSLAYKSIVDSPQIIKGAYFSENGIIIDGLNKVANMDRVVVHKLIN
jgi:hypothetical protein